MSYFYDLSIVNGTVVTGDGSTVLENSSIKIRDESITDVQEIQFIPYDSANKTIDAEGDFVIPGIINHHVHHIIFGTGFLYGIRLYRRERIAQILNRHLLQGTTTLMNVDGIDSVWAVNAMNKLHPINIKASTGRVPSIYKLRDTITQEPIEPKYTTPMAEEMLKLGAVALGELGQLSTTLGVTYWKNLTGQEVSLSESRMLMKSLFGGKVEIAPTLFDEENVEATLHQLGFSNTITLHDMKEVKNLMETQFSLSINALKEAAALSKKTGTPLIAHHSPENTHTIMPIARELSNRFIAAHSNHLFEEPETAINRAKELKKHGAIIDIYTGDSFHARQMCPTLDVTLAMLEHNVVDIISTDYCAGWWDPILLVLEEAVNQGVIELPNAIALATSNVTKAVPRLAPYRGLIAPGNVADIIIVDADHISKIKTVIIGGRVIVEDGNIRREAISALERTWI